MIPRILDMLFLSAPHLAGDDVRQRSEERRRYRFYPRHPRGWRPTATPQSPTSSTFLSTPPSRVATDQFGGECHYNKWFLSTPPSRVATRPTALRIYRGESFYPRHPRGWRPAYRPPCTMFCSSFYPRHPRGWRRQHRGPFRFSSVVSIHATLAGGDLGRQGRWLAVLSFYPRHPRGWRQARFCVNKQLGCFYPRHPRGWRRRYNPFASRDSGFYPRHPRGWRQASLFRVESINSVSIHATLAGGDMWQFVKPSAKQMFLSTPPSRVVTYSPLLH